MLMQLSVMGAVSVMLQIVVEVVEAVAVLRKPRPPVNIT